MSVNRERTVQFASERTYWGRNRGGRCSGVLLKAFAESVDIHPITSRFGPSWACIIGLDPGAIDALIVALQEAKTVSQELAAKPGSEEKAAVDA